MYFSSSQYPEFRGLSGAQQSSILKAAIAAHEPSQWKRFTLALALALAAGYLIDHLVFVLGAASTALDYAGMVFTGLSFYGYLLWEINTRTHAAVRLHLAANASDW